MPTEEQRAEALQLLGINNEDHLRLIRDTVADSSAGVEKLVNIVPLELIALAQHLENPEGVDFLSGQLPAGAEAVTAIKTIYDQEIGSLASHPVYPAIAKILKCITADKSLSSIGKRAAISSQSAFVSIQSVSQAPLLLGKKSPFLPLLKLEVISTEEKPLWVEELHWFDVLFLAKSLAQGVVDHAEGIAEMIEAGQITPAPDGFGETLDELEQTLPRLRQLLLSKQN